MSEPKKPAGSRWMHELEERVAALLDLQTDARAAGFRALREEYPDHADLLLRWERSADLVLDAAEDVPPSVDLGVEGEGTRIQIGEYRILRCLGEGGMGIVYLAERAGDRQRVALKVVRQGLSCRDILTRFEAEASALRRLSHPNTAALVDSGATEDGRPYFAMRYVPGLAIHEYCDRQQVDVRGRVALLRQACCTAISSPATSSCRSRTAIPSP